MESGFLNGVPCVGGWSRLEAEVVEWNGGCAPVTDWPLFLLDCPWLCWSLLPALALEGHLGDVQGIW